MTTHQPPSPQDFADIRALLINCSLNKDSAQSHTGRLLGAVGDLMSRAGAQVDTLYALDYCLPPGVYPDMREHGWAEDAWPETVWPRVQQADILVIGTPLWLGEESSVCRIIIERLYAMSGELNEKGQSSFYGKVGGAVREHMITHVVPYDDAPGFLRHLVADRPDFMQVVFAHE